jgi:hypothetical protein
MLSILSAGLPAADNSKKRLAACWPWKIVRDTDSVALSRTMISRG